MRQEEPSPGAARLAARLRGAREGRALSREAVVEHAARLGQSISADRVRQLEDPRKPWKPPSRKPRRGRRYVLDVLVEVIGLDLPTLLRECFTRDDLANTYYATVFDQPSGAEVRGHPSVEHPTLRAFVESLPADAEADTMFNPAQLRNARAFAYVFALEKIYCAVELAFLKEPPVILLDQVSLDEWVEGMRLQDDRDEFERLVREYRSHFRALAFTGRKRYRIVLLKHTFLESLLRKSKSDARAMIDDIIDLLQTAERFDLVILDDPDYDGDELEVISGSDRLPVEQGVTQSLIIRQQPRSATVTEYALAPIPDVRRDIAKFEQYWTRALRQYEKLAESASFWPDPKATTIRLLLDLARRFA